MYNKQQVRYEQECTGNVQVGQTNEIMGERGGRVRLLGQLPRMKDRGSAGLAGPGLPVHSHRPRLHRHSLGDPATQPRTPPTHSPGRAPPIHAYQPPPHPPAMERWGGPDWALGEEPGGFRRFAV